MTVPRPIQHMTKRLADAVGQMFPALRRAGLSKEESSLGIYLRGNQGLHDALVAVLRTRIEGRAAQPEPSDPLVAKSMLARDREIQWVIYRLGVLLNSPTNDGPAGTGEPPA